MTTTHNVQNARLGEGLTALGHAACDYTRNCTSDKCSGYCTLGCKRGEKQSTDVTFLADAARHGAKIFIKCFAERILTTEQSENGSGAPVRQVQGVLLKVGGTGHQGSADKSLTVLVRCPVVVCSGGSLHTPALVLRSGITGGGRVGANLRLHPTVAASVVFPRKVADQPSVRPWEGAPMSVYCTDYAGWCGSGYGPFLSVASSHPGVLAAAFPWRDGVSYKEHMLKMADSAVWLAIVRDHDSGRIVLGEEGRPEVRYWPSQRDQESIIQGMEALVRAAVASGASEVWTLHQSPLVYKVDDHHSDERLEEFLTRIRNKRVRKHDLSLFSAHQMGSMAMGVDPKTSACNQDGQVWGVQGLYVADASVMPTCSGVNPMITTEAVAYMIANRISMGLEVERRGPCGSNREVMVERQEPPCFSDKPRVTARKPHITPTYDTL